MTLLWPCFALSGAAALALELLWMRSAALVLGGTATTTATVLACYFAGLAGGAALARGGTTRPVRRYGRLELGAAAGALWSLAVFHLLATDAARAALGAGGPIGVLAVAVATLPATLCLGATLPALGQALAGERTPLLYALNTLGGVAGIVAMGFGLPATIGVRSSYLVAASASALAGLVALGIVERPVALVALAAVPAARRLRLVAAAAGFLGLALEVLWTRLFAQVLHNSVYSFAAVALVFLLALAGGAALAGPLLRRNAPATVARAALALAAVGTLAGIGLFVWWTRGLTYFGMNSGLGEYVARIVGLALLAIGPGACAAGVVLPALWAAFGRRAGIARPLGDLTAANTAGAIAGALGAGFVALPMLGLRTSLVAAAVCYLGLAELLAPARTVRRAGMLLVALALLAWLPPRLPFTHLEAGERLLAAREGPAGIVTVVDGPDDRQLRVDSYYALGGSRGASLERRQGLLPLLLHPHPARVAFVGLATGISASAAPALGVADTTVVELLPDVATLARTYFGEWNAGVLDRPEVHLVLDDGRRWLATTPEHFDVIVSDLFIPWHAGTSSLYAREMYAAAAGRLAPGGLFAQWLPLYQLTREDFETIVRTFLTAFPHATLWRDDFYADRPIVALVGQQAPQPVDLGTVERRLQRLPAWARDQLLGSASALAMLSAGDLAAVPDLFAAAPINTDDRPVIEFRAPRLTRMTAAGDKDWFIGESLGAFYDTLEERLASASDPLLPATEEVRAARRAGTALFHYAVAATRGDRERAARLQDEVRRLVPDVVQAAEREPPAGDLIAAEQGLATLQAREIALQHRLDEMERRLDAMTQSGGTPR